MIDHVLALLQYEAKEKRYRAYVTDALRLITENTAKFAGGSYIPIRWLDLESPQRMKEDARTGDEIAADVIMRIGLKLKGTDEGENDG